MGERDDDEQELQRAKVRRGREQADADVVRRPQHHPEPSSGWRTSNELELGEVYVPSPEELSAWAAEKALGATAPRPRRDPAFERARQLVLADVEGTIGRMFDALNALGRPPERPLWRVAEYLISITRASFTKHYNFIPNGRHSGSRMGVCGASNSKIARKLNLSVPTVRRAVAELVKLGLVLHHRTGRAALRVLTPPAPGTAPAVTSTSGPPKVTRTSAVPMAESLRTIEAARQALLANSDAHLGGAFPAGKAGNDHS